MKNEDLAAVFDEIANLLEIQGEQIFRINSYRKTARTLRDLVEDVVVVAAEARLADLEGIGKATIEKINEFLTHGTISLHQELRASVPAGLIQLLQIPGLGPKKVSQMWKELEVVDVISLKAVIESGTLAKLKGMGAKTVENIIAGLTFTEKSSGRTPLGLALPLAEELAAQLKKVKGVRRVEVGGSLRRGCETIGDIDLLCASDNGAAIVEAFTKFPQVKKVLASGDTKGSVLVERRDGVDIQVDCRVVPDKSFGAALQYFTGSKEHNVRIREMAGKRKWKLNEWGLFDGEKQLAGKDEEAIYEKLGLPYFPPEMREDRGEFDLTESPRLITLEDIRGDLHMHTEASDGTADAATMAAAAAELGYEYIAITDHSKSSVIANGLSIDRMWRQIEKIRQLNKRLDTIAVLVGCECDILPDGSLDYPDSVLTACDFVVASAHSAMKQERSKITGRVLDAMDNPYVTLLGHPTGRLINRREPMDLDMTKIVEKAAETNTALEVNASWQRLDMCDKHVRMATEAGVKVSIDTDSHSTAQLEQMRLGVLTARRGWLRPENVINTLPLPSLRKWISKKRKKK